MELDITEFFNTACHRQFSASIAELGQDAGRITWENAKGKAADCAMLDTEEKRAAFRDHVRKFGAWSDDEIAAWSDVELNALLLQFISGDIRETPDMSPDAWDWSEYERMASAGIVAGNMFRGTYGRIYYSIGA